MRVLPQGPAIITSIVPTWPGFARWQNRSAFLEEFGEGGITIGMFWEKLEGQLPTKQSVDRVYKHYHREMVDKEYIRIPS